MICSRGRRVLLEETLSFQRKKTKKSPFNSCSLLHIFAIFYFHFNFNHWKLHVLLQYLFPQPAWNLFLNPSIHWVIPRQEFLCSKGFFILFFWSQTLQMLHSWFPPTMNMNLLLRMLPLPLMYNQGWLKTFWWRQNIPRNLLKYSLERQEGLKEVF